MPEAIFDFKRFFTCLLEGGKINQASARFQAHLAIGSFERGHEPKRTDFNGETKALTSREVDVIRYFFDVTPEPKADQ